MGKRVVLKLDGDLEQQGFQVTLEIGEEGQLPTVEQTGYLPPSPALAHCLEQWQQRYQELAGPTRIVLKGITVQSAALSLHERLEAFRQLVQDLERHLRSWLESSESFHRVDRRLRESLDPNESIRVLIRTLDTRLHHLPWHLWDFIEQYTQAEVTLGASKFSPPYQHASDGQGKVRILAILGDSNGIDVTADRQLLENLPDAEVKFLVEPTRQNLSYQLWEQQWHILFFAGHSRTEKQQGRIYINSQESLTVEEVKFGLKRSIAQGLQLAIFNSCDGLGLAYELEQLNLPQLIVMREPVADRVAQTFLKYLLAAYSSGKSLYLAVRQARERLHEELEQEFPCAGWLPVLYQNPVGVPPKWEDWVRHTTLPVPATVARPSRTSLDRISALIQHQFNHHLPILWLSLLTTLLIVSLRFLGIFETLELSALDQMMQIRPNEGIDPRILIVEVTDADVQAQRQRGERMERISTSAQTQGETFPISLSDQSLQQLLNVLAKHHPRVIGLDVYRDFAVDPEQAQLATTLQTLPLFTICKAEDFENQAIPSIDPPPEVAPDRLGFSDFQADKDGILRRHLLTMYPEVWSPQSKCTVNNSFSVQVAFSYLHSLEIPAEFIRRGDRDDLQLGKHTYQVLRSHAGGYQKLPSGGGGNQILLNYRASEEVATRVSLNKILQNQVNPDYITDKIVLIGVTAQVDDYWQTPYHPETPAKTPGVMIQAHMISQLINAALPEENRPLIWVWAVWQEAIWIFGWTVAASMLICRIGIRSESIKRSLQRRSLIIALLMGGLYGVCLGILLRGGWLPFVPSALAIVLSASMMQLYLFRQIRHSRNLLRRSHANERIG